MSVYETNSRKSFGFGVVRAAQRTWLIIDKSNTHFILNRIEYKTGGHIVTHALQAYLILGAVPHVEQSGIHFYVYISQWTPGCCFSVAMPTSLLRCQTLNFSTS